MNHAKSNQTSFHRYLERKGAMLPFVAVVIIILFVSASLAIDIARIHVTRSELRTATDAAARAGVEALGRLQSRDAAVAAALNAARQNIVAGQGLDLDPSQIVFGTSTQNSDGTFSFDPDGSTINSINVTGERRNGSPNGPVNMMFGPIFGVTEFETVQTATATRLDRDIALVLDVSGSMRRDNRFAALQDALDVFLSELESSPQEERISLTVYSTDDRKLVDLTPNMLAIREAFAEESPGGFTAIGEGLKTGLKSIEKDKLRREFALKSIILMTDGNHNRGVSPDIIAQDVADADITLHTVTFSAGANQALMRTCADIGGGIHLHADDEDELEEQFRALARTLKVLLTD